jgi:hypothetical protein
MMLQALPKNCERIFGLTTPKNAQNNFKKARATIAKKV